MTTKTEGMLNALRAKLESLLNSFRDTEGEGNASSDVAVQPPEPAPVKDSVERASDKELRSILRHFGWEPSETDAGAAAMPEVLLKETPARKDAREIFGGLSSSVLHEVFTAEDLQELEADEKTHVFTQEDMELLAKQPAPTAPAAATAEPAAPSRHEKRKEAAAEDFPAEEEYTKRDFRPIRRRRRYRVGLMGGLMYFGFVVCASVILASLGWLAANDVLSLNKPLAEAEVFVGEESSLEQISRELHSKGIIQYPALFRLIGTFTRADEKIDPGTYSLSTKLDYVAIIRNMQQEEGWTGIARETVTVLIPEGKTLKQTFQILAESGVCAYETLLDCSSNYEFDYDFLADMPYGDERRLEGYLFPDTYEFYVDSDPESVIEKFLDNFDSKLPQEMRDMSTGYTLHELLTIASLVEMEAGSNEERATVASVIYNRLNSSYYPYLQIDATVQYALEERKEYLSEQDLQVDSPYNTYLHQGLPPGPIANPGLASIRGALHPDSTGYYFYALNESGTHEFFSSYSQFEQFINSSSFGG